MLTLSTKLSTRGSRIRTATPTQSQDARRRRTSSRKLLPSLLLIRRNHNHLDSSSSSSNSKCRVRISRCSNRFLPKRGRISSKIQAASSSITSSSSLYLLRIISNREGSTISRIKLRLCRHHSTTTGLTRSQGCSKMIHTKKTSNSSMV